MWVLSCQIVSKFLQLHGLYPTRLHLSMGFSKQEYWSELPCPPPGDLPDPGIKPVSFTSPASAGGFFTTNATWEVQMMVIKNSCIDLSTQRAACVCCSPGGKDYSRDAAPPVPVRLFVSLCTTRKEKMPAKLWHATQCMPHLQRVQHESQHWIQAVFVEARTAQRRKV